MTKPKAVESLWPDILNIRLIPAVAHLRTLPERRNVAAREMLVRRIRAEFEEMPGLSVTLKQATRLFGLTADAGSRIFSELIEARVIRMRTDRSYILRTHSS